MKRRVCKLEQEPLAQTPKEVGVGYRNDNTTAVAKGDDPETMYMVIDGRHFNDACCFVPAPAR